MLLNQVTRLPKLEIDFRIIFRKFEMQLILIFMVCKNSGIAIFFKIINCNDTTIQIENAFLFILKLNGFI